MNTIRRFFLVAIVVISSSLLALAGEIQGPGKSDPAPTPVSAVATATIQPSSTEQNQVVWQDSTALLVEILLTIF